MKRAVFLTIILALVTGSTAFAVSGAAQKGLEAFRRYEPDFLNSFMKLQDLGRKISQEKIAPDTERFQAIKDEAQDLMDFVQKRYDLMEDLFKSLCGDYPDDKAALFDGFNRIDDLYRKCRDYFLEQFENRGEASNVAPETKPATSGQAAAKPASTEAVKEPSKELSQDSKEKKDSPAAVMPALPAPTTTGSAKPEPEQRQVHLSGNLRLDLRNRNEKYTAENKALPNNLSQGKLTLMYKMDQRNRLVLEDKYLQRKRNELVKENVLTLAWVHTRSPKTIFTLKDTLHHVWYPDNTQKEYRYNLAEFFWNRKVNKWEHLNTVGYEDRVYRNYSRSDFTQLNFDSQTTYFVPSGTLFGQGTGNWRSYKNSSVLDYSNLTLYGEFNRSYSGNKSDFSVSDTYDTRRFGNESINLFRTSYWDNYFRFNYSLPVSKTFSWVFEDEYQYRAYPSDSLRGYGQLKLRTQANITLDKKTRGKAGHIYTKNIERTRNKAHTNHDFFGMWERRYTDRFKLKVEDNYHIRDGMVGDTLDYKENLISAKATWKLPSKIELSWRNDYLVREYSASFYPDYHYFLTGVLATYAKPKKYDWQLEQSFRWFTNTTGTYQANLLNRTQTHPFSLGKLNYYISRDLKLKFLASREKTYYKTFESQSQELLWDFTRPMTITEFYGGLEYDF